VTAAQRWGYSFVSRGYAGESARPLPIEATPDLSNDADFSLGVSPGGRGDEGDEGDEGDDDSGYESDADEYRATAWAR
jgi:hypothetical protein